MAKLWTTVTMLAKTLRLTSDLFSIVLMMAQLSVVKRTLSALQISSFICVFLVKCTQYIGFL
ncbi:MAG TPA: hypothetical protein DC064_32135 [Cyanobacteria bacterium UBA9273]|nr:hypothetical protein [Cyanobacteria bacterium UBA9273]